MLEARAISKSFVGAPALRDVDFDVKSGEVVGLVGENGAGKSTLMRILSGTHQPDEGDLRIDGKPVKLRNAREAAANGIGMVFQEQSLILNMTVAENIYLGHEEKFTRLGVMNWPAMRKAAQRQLDKIGVNLDVIARVADLSFAARQMIELAKALTLEESSDKPLLILLDEPTSVLNAEEVETLFARVRKLKGRASFVFVSHRLEEVLRVSDRIYVMRGWRGRRSAGRCRDDASAVAPVDGRARRTVGILPRGAAGAAQRRHAYRDDGAHSRRRV
jgi:ribose transport system ATP-binding protein